MTHDPKAVWREAKRLFKKWGDWGLNNQLRHLQTVFPELSEKNAFKAYLAAKYYVKSNNSLSWPGVHFMIERRRIHAHKGTRMTPEQMKRRIKSRVFDIWE